MLTHDSLTNWNAKWIWGGEENSPRNEWWCFRKTFIAPKDGWDEGTISITADSRYTLYINGEQVGRGPARGWPSELPYDTYEIGHLIRPGCENTVAVLVQHFGVSTFYYVRGRGGLLAQLELKEGNHVIQSVVTDSTWRTSKHLGQDSRASRMSCQHAFTERIDANKWDERWVDTNYTDSEWVQASVIGEVGMEPWTTLKPRDIPPLTELDLYPSRIETLNKVVPIPYTVNIDLRNQFIPDSASDSNEYFYAGYIATIIRSEISTKATIGFPYTSPNISAVILNGKRYLKNEMQGVRAERYLELEWKAGDNLLLLELTGKDLGRGLFMGIDCDSQFELVSPTPSEEQSSFVSIGPFEENPYIDHQFDEHSKAISEAIAAYANYDIPLSDIGPSHVAKATIFRQTGAASSASDLMAVQEWMRPVPLSLVSKESVLSLAMWQKTSEPQPVPMTLQPVVHANNTPGVVPVYEAADSEFIIDFGRQAAGYISFEVEAEAGTIIDFYGFEYMRDGWIQHMNYLENSIRYICREGRQAYTSYIRRGFRYLAVTVRGASRPVKIFNVHVKEGYYPIAEIGQFQCSDAMLTDIWKISQTTTKLCMEDTFVDCPAYEQTFWVGDSRNEALIAYYLYGAEDLVKHCLELVPGSRVHTPLYTAQVPSGWNSVIPNWTFFWVNACKEYYIRTGDMQFVHSIWASVDYTLQHYLERIDDDGLLFTDGWNFLDWAPIDQPRDGVVSHQNMFLVSALSDAAELAEWVGEKSKAVSYATAAEELRQAINEHLWSEEQQAYLDCIHADGRESDIFSMQTQVVAYLCDIGSKDRKDILETYLNKTPEHFVPIGSPFMSFFYYEALAKMGQIRSLVDDIRQQYGQMIDYGATTCWEMYPKTRDGQIIETQLTRSHCHAWSAAPAYFLGSSVLGVKEAAPGWTHIVVQPETCGLTWARGSVPLPDKGKVDVSWKVDSNGRFHLDVTIPREVTADVRLPEGFEGTYDIHLIG